MEYATQDALVNTDWVDSHMLSKGVRIVEVDYDPEHAYRKGHVRGATLMTWEHDINDPHSRNIVGPHKFAELMSKHGITHDTTVILYGDFHNWFAAYAFWVFKLYGHSDVRIMNGGRTKWELENKPYSIDETHADRTQYDVPARTPGLRAMRSEVFDMLERNGVRMVDVRSPPEYNGEIAAPGEYSSEGAQRSGHIPGATNIPWLKAINEHDGTFKRMDELRELYVSAGITPDKHIITYCRIGERSSHTWFALKYLLGYPDVSNYDGSWSEWGNTVGAPVER